MKINKLQQYIWATEFLIQDKMSWTKNVFARDSNKQEVDRLSADAVKWCVLGGLDFITDKTKEKTTIFSIVKNTANKIYFTEPSLINDFKGHDVVLNLLNQAFNAARYYRDNK